MALNPNARKAEGGAYIAPGNVRKYMIESERLEIQDHGLIDRLCCYAVKGHRYFSTLQHSVMVTLSIASHLKIPHTNVPFRARRGEGASVIVVNT